MKKKLKIIINVFCVLVSFLTAFFSYFNLMIFSSFAFCQDINNSTYKFALTNIEINCSEYKSTRDFENRLITLNASYNIISSRNYINYIISDAENSKIALENGNSIDGVRTCTLAKYDEGNRKDGYRYGINIKNYIHNEPGDYYCDICHKIEGTNASVLIPDTLGVKMLQSMNKEASFENLLSLIGTTFRYVINGTERIYGISNIFYNNLGCSPMLQSLYDNYIFADDNYIFDKTGYSLEFGISNDFTSLVDFKNFVAQIKYKNIADFAVFNNGSWEKTRNSISYDSFIETENIVFKEIAFAILFISSSVIFLASACSLKKDKRYLLSFLIFENVILIFVSIVMLFFRKVICLLQFLPSAFLLVLLIDLLLTYFYFVKRKISNEIHK